MERRTIDELIALYSLEPTLRDIYVEGPIDKSVIEWFVSSAELNSVGVFDIEMVEVPPEDLIEFHVENNNKGRLIALAHILERNLSVLNIATCIVDKDFDEILENLVTCSMLLYTDYSCIEMYMLNEKAISKTIALGIRRKGLTVDNIFEVLNNIGRDLFLIRLINVVLGLSLKNIEWHNCCDVKSGVAHFDRNEYIKRYLNASGQVKRFDEFVAVVDSFQERLNPDLRNCLNGHDFVEVISWFVRKTFRSRANLTAGEIGNLLYMSLEYSDVADEPMFAQLLKRLSS